MTIETALISRSGGKCELCAKQDQLAVYEVPPASDASTEQCLLICATCHGQIENPDSMDANHWRCLTETMWSQEPAVQVMAYRLLSRLSSEPWAQDQLDMLYLEDETFIKMKPTIVNTMFAAILFAGLAFGKSFIKVLFDNFWNLDDAGWKQLTIRLAVFFLLMAVLNEVVWRNFSTDIWVNVKVFVSPALTFIFFMAQVPFITKHTVEKATEPDE